jgi:hypothetical protein
MIRRTELRKKSISVRNTTRLHQGQRINVDLHLFGRHYSKASWSWDIPIGIRVATSCGLQNTGTSLRPAMGSTQSPIQCVPVALFSKLKAAGEWSWPLTYNLCQGKKYGNIYIHSPIHKLFAEIMLYSFILWRNLKMWRNLSEGKVVVTLNQHT